MLFSLIFFFFFIELLQNDIEFFGVGRTTRVGGPQTLG